MRSLPPLRVLIFMLLVVPATGCGTPEPVQDASDLFVAEATTYKIQLARFAKVSNEHRARSTERLARIHMRTTDFEGRVNRKRTEWGISDNKTAIKVWSELQKLGDRLEKDPSSGRRRDPSRIESLQQKFGKSTASTKDLDKVLKAVASVSKDASTEDVLSAISPFVEAISEAFGEQGKKAAAAFSSASELLSSAARELEPPADN